MLIVPCRNDWRIILLLLSVIIKHAELLGALTAGDPFVLNITMINITTLREDQYVSMSYKLPDEELLISKLSASTQKMKHGIVLVAFTPLVDMNTAHHMLTYACATPAFDKPTWFNGSACLGTQMIIHAWARNGVPLTLPQDVGFAVGRHTPYKYIIINVHYLCTVKDDNSGNQLLVSRTPRQYHAGVMLSGTERVHLPPKTQTIRTTFSCRHIGTPFVIFAAHFHTHRWGRVNSLYRVRNGTVALIAKGSPQWPQSFYALSSPVQIRTGDFVVGQCVYDNNDERAVEIGEAHDDEMCNVYAMYWYEPANKQSPITTCWSDSAGSLMSLIPPDSVMAPATPSDIGSTVLTDQILTWISVKLPADGRYAHVNGWPALNSSLIGLGEIGGLALTGDDHELVIFHRASRSWDPQYFDGYRFRTEIYDSIEEDVIVHIDTRTGRVTSRWGARTFYMPLGLTIDQQGNFWLTDVAMHQVLMFLPSNLTHPKLMVGERFRWGSSTKQFCQPADVAVMKNGDFFVADGYCNNRIIKFDRHGEYIMQWGFSPSGRRDGNGLLLPYEWSVVQSIALHEDASMLCGADQDQFRIQCFDPTTGSFQRQIHLQKDETNTAIYAIEFVPGVNETLLFAVAGDPRTSNGTIYKIDFQHGIILANPNVETVALMVPHDITVSTNAREVYVDGLSSPSESILYKFQLLDGENPTSTKSSGTHTGLTVMFVTPVLLFVILILYRVIRIHKIYRLDRAYASANSNLFFGEWFNQQRGFRRLNEDAEEDLSDEQAI